VTTISREETVDVLLGTYNGAKYIDEFLNSLAAQSGIKSTSLSAMMVRLTLLLRLLKNTVRFFKISGSLTDLNVVPWLITFSF
jgi:hypothetical protein